VKADLLSTRIRLALREELVGWPLGAIGDLFQSEGFVADANHDPRVSGERRTYVEQFYVRINWADWDEVRRVLRILEAVLDQMRLREETETYGDAIEHRRPHRRTGCRPRAGRRCSIRARHRPLGP
jgi:hypothetical protein